MTFPKQNCKMYKFLFICHKGLFNSTNLLMSRNAKTKIETPCDEFKFSYEEFDNVDHRLKLFLYQNIFEDNNEHMKWLIKGRLFNDSTNNIVQMHRFNQLFLLCLPQSGMC